MLISSTNLEPFPWQLWFRCYSERLPEKHQLLPLEELTVRVVLLKCCQRLSRVCTEWDSSYITSMSTIHCNKVIKIKVDFFYPFSINHPSFQDHRNGGLWKSQIHTPNIPALRQQLTTAPPLWLPSRPFQPSSQHIVIDTASITFHCLNMPQRTQILECPGGEVPVYENICSSFPCFSTD